MVIITGQLIVWPGPRVEYFSAINSLSGQVSAVRVIIYEMNLFLKHLLQTTHISVNQLMLSLRSSFHPMQIQIKKKETN